MNLNTIKNLPVLAAPLILMTAKFAYAGSLTLPDTNITGITSFFAIMCTLVNYFFTMIMIIAVAMFLVAAFTFLTAGDNAQGQEKAKKYLLYGIVGVIVALLPKALINIAASFFGVASTSVDAC